MMRPLAWLLALSVLASPLLADEDRTAGLAAYEARNYREAFSRLSTARQNAPDDREIAIRAYSAAMELAKELLAAKQYRDVLPLCEWALGIDRELLPEDLRFVASYNKGEAFLGLGKADEALIWLKEARELTKRPVVLRELGMAYYKKEAWPDAVLSFTQYSQSPEVKKDANLIQHLAHATYQAGDIAKALEIVRQARLEFPQDPTLAQLETKYSREDRTEGNMQQSSGVYFDVKFEETPDQQDLRSRILKALDEAYSQVTRSYSHFPDKNVPVVIYSSNVAFGEGSGAPRWAAANFDGKIRIPVEAAKASDDSLRRVVTHEFTHYIVHRITKGNCPAWIHEGLAQIEEKNEKEWASATLRRYMGNRNLKAQILDLSRLESSFGSIQDSELANLAYAESYLATKFIVDRHGAHEVSQILDALSTGSSFADVLSNRLGVDSAGFQKQWLTAQAEEFHLEW